MNYSDALQYALRTAKANIRNAQATIDKFAARLGTDPVGAFRWADDAIKASATLALWKAIADSIERNEFDATTGLAKIEEWLRAGVLSGAQYPASSSSMCGNAVETAELAAKAKAYGEISMIIASIKE